MANKQRAYLVNLVTLATIAFTSERAATDAQGEHDVLVTNEQDMSKLDMKDLVRMHNMVRPEKPITKFSDRATANKRMWPVLEYLADTNPNKEKPMATRQKPKAAKTRAKSSTNGTKPGRISAYAGKMLVATRDNPRREGTAAHKSFALTEGKGILYEDFKKRGGRRQDLAYDIKHKWVKVVKA